MSAKADVVTGDTYGSPRPPMPTTPTLQPFLSNPNFFNGEYVVMPAHRSGAEDAMSKLFGILIAYLQKSHVSWAYMVRCLTWQVDCILMDRFKCNYTSLCKASHGRSNIHSSLKRNSLPIDLYLCKAERCEKMTWGISHYVHKRQKRRSFAIWWIAEG